MAKKLISYDDEAEGTGLPDVVEEGLNATYRRAGTTVFDSFTDVPDGQAPSLSDSGHQWVFAYEPKRVEVRDGLLVAHTGGEYPEIDAGGNVNRLGCSFILDPSLSAVPEDFGISLNSWDVSITNPGAGRVTRAHISMYPGQVSLGIRTVQGEPIIEVVRHMLSVDWQLGVEYTFEWFIAGDSIFVRCPDGSAFSYTDPAIADVYNPFANWQFIPTADPDVGFHLSRVWADTAHPGDMGLDVGVEHEALRSATRPLITDVAPLRAQTRGGHGEVLSVDRDSGDLTISRGAPGAASIHITDTELQIVVDGQVVARGRATGLELGGKPLHLDSRLSGPSITQGLGDPEGVVTARLGSIYLHRGDLSITGDNMAFIRRIGPTESNTGWVPLLSPPRGYSSAWFDDATTRINATRKFAGKQEWNTDLKRPVWASGPNPTDTWVFADGTVAHTPD